MNTLKFELALIMEKGKPDRIGLAQIELKNKAVKNNGKTNKSNSKPLQM